MAHDEFNNGARHGFKMALYAVRDVDRELEYPKERFDCFDKTDSIRYNSQKDLLYKIYESIKKMMKEEVYENDN
tara:strand:- start:7791 stop:8012 length:222 start_codon:yes stop_codon:yes gene_type:complete